MRPINSVVSCPTCHRRNFLRSALAGSAALFTVPGALAEALTRTPRDAEGPFYPDNLPLDTDNDLLVVNDKITPAVGAVSYLGGVVMDTRGQPLRNAVVEIWQVDNQGIYLHSKANGQDKRDRNFQSYGRFLTGSRGQYHFRTIKPPAYPGRTPHIHVAVSHRNKRILTTQLYIEGEKQNANDFLYKRLGGGDPKLQKLVTIPFNPLEGSKTGELTARLDLVVGLTPEDPGKTERDGQPRRQKRR
ncbi:MAG: intradiol ring-cleavage dioxygenase [Roseibacillus sp.]|nr:intradiol ring-cleavage dioxygenase [Roseibacillus sp.]